MNHIQKTAAIFLIAAALLANGCAGAENQISGLETSDSSPEPSIAPGEPSDSKEEAVSQSSPENGEPNPEERETKDGSQASPPALKETDWSALFGAFHGAAVLYDEKENSVLVYQPELARTRRSPLFHLQDHFLPVGPGKRDPDAGAFHPRLERGGVLE